MYNLKTCFSLSCYFCTSLVCSGPVPGFSPLPRGWGGGFARFPLAACSLCTEHHQGGQESLKYRSVVGQTKDFLVSRFSGWVLALPAFLCCVLLWQGPYTWVYVKSASSLSNRQNSDSLLKAWLQTQHLLAGNKEISHLIVALISCFSSPLPTVLVLSVLPVLILHVAAALLWAVKTGPSDKWCGTLSRSVAHAAQRGRLGDTNFCANSKCNSCTTWGTKRKGKISMWCAAAAIAVCNF